MYADYSAQQPTALWNSVRGVWEKPTVNLFCAHSELFSEAWPTSGMMLDGQVYGLPMQALPTVGLESSLLPTLKARDAQAEGYEAGLRRATPQVGTIVKGIAECDERVSLPTPRNRDYKSGHVTVKNAQARIDRGYGLDVSEAIALMHVPEEAMLRTPSVTDSTGGAISEDQARERGRMVKTADQVAQLAFQNGLKVSPAIEQSLLPTPNTMEHREIKTKEQIAELKKRSPGGYRNLREEIVNELLPTPAVGHIRNHDEPVEDYLERREKFENGEYKGMPGASLGVAVRMEVLPTPTTRDHKDGTAPHERNGEVQVDTVARAIFNSGEVLLGTPRATASESSATQVEAGAPKARIEDQVLATNWGKFEPAIRRWEQVLGRPAPEPTKPDGKDGAHRLSSRFTEWMMGLPDGWITDCGLSRNDELKACGNGVVPQQAFLALTMLLGEKDAR